MKHIKFLSISLFILLFAVKASAQTTDDVLNILIAKGTITQQDADSIRAAAAIAKQSAPKPKIFPLSLNTPAFQLSGYTQVRYQTYPKANKPDGLDIRRARLSVGGTIRKWEYGVQVDFVGGTSSTVAGGTTSSANTFLSPVLLDAYIAYKFDDYLKVTTGQFLVPFSSENNISDKTLETVDRSQVVNALVARKGDGLNGLVDSLGNQNGRDLGVQISGSLVKLKKGYLIDYYAGLFNGAGINEPDNNESKDFSGRLLVHPFSILTLGGSYYDGYDKFAKTSAGKDQLRTRWGVEGTLTYKKLYIRSEFIRGQDGNDRHYVAQPQPAIHQGWYAVVAYYVLPKLQAVFKYDTYSPEVNPKFTGLHSVSDASTYFIFGANYYFNPNVKLTANYNWRTEQGKIPAIQNNNVVTAQLQLAF
ncbi:MAG TPA: porin [Ferruginibacter sp.]|nr:porin [Ferruginibacter sp.]